MKPVEPLAYQKRQAAAALGVSVDFFAKHIEPHVPCRYVGDLRLWRVADLERFMERLPDRAPGIVA